MDDVRGELDRLRRGWGTARARTVAGRVHLVVLGAALVAAFGSRVLGPWPGVGALEGRWVATAIVIGALALLGPVLALLLARLLHPPRVAFARQLDDRMAWHDAADTALGLSAERSRRLDTFLTTQTTGRLRGLDVDRLWPKRLSGRWPRRILLFLFAFVLLAPGVTGLFDERGAGRGERAGLGARPEEQEPDEPVGADRWQRDHMRLFLRAEAPKERPLEIRLRWKTDEPLPAAWAGDLVLLFDGEEVDLATVLEAAAGEEVDQTIRFDLAEIEALQELLTPGRHVAQALLRPRLEPWQTVLQSNRLEIVLEDGGGGGDGDGEDEQEEPQPQPQPEGQPEPQPEPEPEPQPEPPPPPPSPEGPDEVPAPPPPGEGPEDVVDPFVRDEAETVHKDDAIVAVPDPEAGLKPPPPVPLSEAMREFERIVEQALGDERVRGADREFLLRYFRALRGDPKTDGEAKR